jgi:hypothetical protein
MALSSLTSGALVTTQGWTLLNVGSAVPILLVGVALMWLAIQRRRSLAEERPRELGAFLARRLRGLNGLR